jgi:ribosomal protein S18 acetylase RimI-like enzyme
MLLKRVLGYALRKVQGFSLYRKIARFLRRGIRIIEATDEDMKQVRGWFDPGREVKTIPNPNATNFVAKKDQEVVGFVQLVTCPNNTLYTGWWLFSLAVKTLYQGMGIGEGLSRVVMERAKQENAKGLYLLVRQDNYKAINLYRKLGFENRIIPALEERLRQERLETGYRRVVLSKALPEEQT